MNKLKIAQQNRNSRLQNIAKSVSTYTQDQDKLGFTTLEKSSDKIESASNKEEGGEVDFRTNGNGPAM